MPTSLSQLEVAAPFGALDSDACTASEFVSAHVLRTMQMNARRLAYRGEYLIDQVWTANGNNDAEEDGGRMLDVPRDWMRFIGPCTVQRKRHLLTGTLQVRARISSGTTVQLQVETGQHAVSSASAVNVMDMTGTGSWAWYTMTDVRLGRQDADEISLWVRANADQPWSTGAFGTPDTGTADVVSTLDFRDIGATWTPAAINANLGRLFVEFYNTDGIVLARRGVRCTFTDTLAFDTPLPQRTTTACNASGVEYRLLEGPAMRLASVTLREDDGT
jgi:hypothetical protein